MKLFQPRFKDERLNHYFKQIITDEVYEPAIKSIEEWAIGFSDRKKESDKFINEFQTTFSSSLWELYLNKAFKLLGFSIDYSKESPDFLLEHKSGKTLNVEAVTSNKPSENEIDATKLSEEEFLNYSSLKLLRKINDKRKLFLGIDRKKHPYSSLTHVKGKPFIVAIAPFDNDLSFSQNNTAINKVLFRIDPPKRSPDGFFSTKKSSHIETYSGEKIEIGIFTNDSFKEISAVIFSTTGMFGKAILQGGIDCTVKSTRYRQSNIIDFLQAEGSEKLGVTETKLSETHEIWSFRQKLGNIVFGSDMHLCKSSEHKETHLDGLHIYYNPYSEVPLDKDIFQAYEITHNFYDTSSEEMICNHNDGSLVSRQVFTGHI